MNHAEAPYNTYALADLTSGVRDSLQPNDLVMGNVRGRRGQIGRVAFRCLANNGHGLSGDLSVKFDGEDNRGGLEADLPGVAIDVVTEVLEQKCEPTLTVTADPEVIVALSRVPGNRNALHEIHLREVL